jgi:hypothetical protein
MHPRPYPSYRGQFVDHDLDLGGGSHVAGVDMNIVLGADDPLEEFNVTSGQGLTLLPRSLVN